MLFIHYYVYIPYGGQHRGVRNNGKKEDSNIHTKSDHSNKPGLIDDDKDDKIFANTVIYMHQ